MTIELNEKELKILRDMVGLSCDHNVNSYGHAVGENLDEETQEYVDMLSHELETKRNLLNKLQEEQK